MWSESLQRTTFVFPLHAYSAGSPCGSGPKTSLERLHVPLQVHGVSGSARCGQSFADAQLSVQLSTRPDWSQRREVHVVLPQYCSARTQIFWFCTVAQP